MSQARIPYPREDSTGGSGDYLEKHRTDIHSDKTSPSTEKGVSAPSASPGEHHYGVNENLTVVRPGVLPQKPKLTVCMIVRDEEKVLPRCLKSVQAVADELIVVDTGSQDNTVSIAKDAGAKVFNFKWRDDFAAARNESLRHATGDWILQIDADEELLSGSVLHLRDRMLASVVLCYHITCDNGPASGAMRFAWFARLFRNHPQLRYHRPYHERVNDSVQDLIESEPQWQVQYEPSITIRHHGYDSFAATSRKLHRGLPIMKSYLMEHPNDAFMLTKLGSVYRELGLYDVAEAHFKKALKINPNLPDTSFALGLTLQIKKKPGAAIKCYKKAIANAPEFVAAYAKLGEIYIEKGMFDSAISELKRALTINPHVSSIHTCLGLAYRSKGMLDKSVEEFRKGVAIDPDFADGYASLGEIYMQKRMLDNAISELRRAITINPDMASAHNNLAVVYFVKKRYKLAVQHCDRALKLGFQVDPEFLQDLKAHR